MKGPIAQSGKILMFFVDWAKIKNCEYKDGLEIDRDRRRWGIFPPEKAVDGATHKKNSRNRKARKK